MVMALLHGFVLQRAAFDLPDPAGFARDVRVALGEAELPRTSPHAHDSSPADR